MTEVWGHSDDRNTDLWRGACPSREEAILDGTSEYGGEPFWVQRGVPRDPADYVPDVADIIEQMAENAADDVGEPAADWPDVGKEAKAALAALLQTWARKHCPVHFWSASGDPEEVTPPGPEEPK